MFYVMHHTCVTLDNIDEFANFLILIQQVISQGFVVFKKIFILFIQSFQLSCRLQKIPFLILVFFYQCFLMLFKRTICLLYHRRDLVS